MAGSYYDATFKTGWLGQHYTFSTAMENSNYVGFDALTPTITTQLTTINYPHRGTWPWEPGQWGSRWRGIINIVTAGAYTFYLNSDDGSWLWVNDVMIVDNGGSHAMQVVTGVVTLSAGTHNVRIHFFEGGGGGQV